LLSGGPQGAKNNRMIKKKTKYRGTNQTRGYLVHWTRERAGSRDRAHGENRARPYNDRAHGEPLGIKGETELQVEDDRGPFRLMTVGPKFPRIGVLFFTTRARAYGFIACKSSEDASDEFGGRATVVNVLRDSRNSVGRGIGCLSSPPN
jgi:hypothetical protein